MIRRSILLISIAAVVAALTASVALAANFGGTSGNDTIRGTQQADVIKGFAGNDELFGRFGNDRLFGSTGNDTLRGQAGADRINGGKGDDRLLGNTGSDLVLGGAGDDYIAVRGDGRDKVFCGPNFDVANVSLNDIIGGRTAREGTTVEGILTSVTEADQAALSCEVLIVEGLRVPLGAIVDLPSGLEADVSRVLEQALRDGDLDVGEIADLEEVFDLIDQGLLDDLRSLLGDLLGVL